MQTTHRSPGSIPLRGETIAERYRVGDLVARGLSDVVFRARDLHDDRDVRLKLIRLAPELEIDDCPARYSEVAAAAKQLEHPNIQACIDTGETSDGAFYVATEWLEGTSLKSHIRGTGPMPSRAMARILLQICDGLALAHSAGVRHGDLTSDNIFLARDGEEEIARICDFGLATPASFPQLETSHANVVWGTPSYVSPEALIVGKVGKEADVYALGHLALEMMYGRPLFDAPTAEQTLLQQVWEPARIAAPLWDSPLGPWLAKCLSKDPAVRIADGEALANLMSKVLVQLEDFTLAAQEIPPLRETEYLAEQLATLNETPRDLADTFRELPTPQRYTAPLSETDDEATAPMAAAQARAAVAQMQSGSGAAHALLCPICGEKGLVLGETCPHDGAYFLPARAVADAVGDAVIGTLAAGRYLIISRIGEGGMGSVYLARQISVGRDVAFKVLKADGNQDSVVAQRRFEREARAVSKISHPNIITLHDFGFLDGGHPFMVMEYAVGVGLDSWARQADLTIERVVHVVRQMLSALSDTHALGIVHRDLKPANAIVTERGADTDFVKLLDFGIARVVNSETLTNEGEVFGTPFYMAPEQARGSSETGPATDVYAMGVILFELVTGRRPYEAPHALSVLFMHATEPIPNIVPRPGLEVSDELVSVIRRAMAKAPRDRYADASEMLLALGEATSQLTQLADRDRYITPMPALVPSPTAPSDPPLDADKLGLMQTRSSASASSESIPSAEVNSPTSSPSAERMTTKRTRRVGWLVAPVAALILGGAAALVLIESAPADSNRSLESGLLIDQGKSRAVQPLGTEARASERARAADEALPQPQTGNSISGLKFSGDAPPTDQPARGPGDTQMEPPIERAPELSAEENAASPEEVKSKTRIEKSVDERVSSPSRTKPPSTPSRDEGRETKTASSQQPQPLVEGLMRMDELLPAEEPLESGKSDEEQDDESEKAPVPTAPFTFERRKSRP